MFTGLVDDVGTIEEVREAPEGRILRVACRYDDLVEGESVAVNGVCLTVREQGPRWFTAGAITTTLGRTAIGDYAAGRRVNLERAMRLSDRLGGHIVQGHVDGVAVVRDVRMQGDARVLDLALPRGLAELMVMHGSVAVEGVSLTVNDLPAEDTVQISLVEYTLRHTTLGDLVAGERVHVEADVLAKHVQRLLAAHLQHRTT